MICRIAKIKVEVEVMVYLGHIVLIQRVCVHKLVSREL